MHASLRRILWAGTGAVAVLTAISCLWSGLSLAAESVTWALAMGVAAIICLLRPPEAFGARERLVRLLEGVLLLALIGALGTVLTYVAMRHSHGFCDDLLDRADHALGFDWPAIRRVVTQRPWLLWSLEMAYSGFAWLPFVLLGLLSRARRSDQLYAFLLAYGLALAVTVVAFFFFPARAAFAFYPDAAAALPANAAGYGEAIAEIRSGAITTLNLLELEGIVTFPSFHATMAILFVWGGWSVAGRLRAPLVAINAGMWVAAVPIGGHYVVDLIGGSVVALAAIQVTRRITGRMTERAAPALAETTPTTPGIALGTA